MKTEINKDSVILTDFDIINFSITRNTAKIVIPISVIKEMANDIKTFEESNKNAR